MYWSKNIIDHYTSITGKTVTGWIVRYFINCHVFLNFWYLICQPVSHRLRHYHCVSVLLFNILLDFSIYFFYSCMGINCHHKDFTGRVISWKKLYSHQNKLLQAQFYFSGKKHIPKWVPLACVVQPIRSPENPGTTVSVLVIEPHGLKTQDIAPKSEINSRICPKFQWVAGPLTKWQGTKIMVPAMAAMRHALDHNTVLDWWQ